MPGTKAAQDESLRRGRDPSTPLRSAQDDRPGNVDADSPGLSAEPQEEAPGRRGRRPLRENGGCAQRSETAGDAPCQLPPLGEAQQGDGAAAADRATSPPAPGGA